MNKISLIVDFDSTIVSVESLEALFELALRNHPDRDTLLASVSAITNAGMNGEIPFSESLSRRIELLPMSKELINETVGYLAATLSQSFIENVSTLNLYDLHIVSGGFKELIIPLVEPLGISASHVHANTFIFESNVFKGVDTSNPLANNNGKTIVAKSLNLRPIVIGIGDGYSDLQVKASGVANQFFYYSEFVEREKVIPFADRVVHNFDEVVAALSVVAQGI